jgi:hypothetical protein
MLENTRREIYYQLDVLRATKGAHVEVYWCVVKNFLSVGVCMCGLCNVWLCVCVGFIMCGYVYAVFFDNCEEVLVICVLVFTVFCIVWFMYMFSYFFCLYSHQVATQLQFINTTTTTGSSSNSSKCNI